MKYTDPKKQRIYQSLINIGLVSVLIFIFIYYNNCSKGRAVSLPEEITVAKKGDSMIVDSVDKDSVYVIFNNKRNKK